MTRHPGTPSPPSRLPGSTHPPLCPSPRAGFSTHKYLLVAIVECLQARYPCRRAPPTGPQKPEPNHPWTHELSAERAHTPCIVMREHVDRGDISVARVDLEHLSLPTQTLAEWMHAVVPGASLSRRDTLHLAMASTVPDVPMLVHSIVPDAESFTHTYAEGVWSVCTDDRLLLRTICHAQMVATAVPWVSEPVAEGQVGEGEAGTPCDLAALARMYDHVAVHAALVELREFRRRQEPCRAGSLLSA